MQSSQTYSIDLPRPEAGSAGVELPTSVAAEGVDSMPDQPMVVVHTALARRSTRSNEDAVEPVAEAGKKTDGPLPEPDAYQMVRRALRGRYGRAILLGLLGAAAGCAVGWKVGKRHYKAEGLIRIAYSRSMIGFETDQNKPVAMYEAYMRTQQEILESRGILAKSLLDPEWQAIGRDASQDTLEAIAEEVAVQRPAGTEHLLVTVTDDNPVIAAAAVRAIVNTYKTDFNAENEEFEQQRLRVLEEGRQSLQAQLDSVEAKIRSIGGEFVTTNLDSLFDAAAQRAAMLESKLLDVRLSLALAQGAAGTADVPPVTGKPGPAESVSLLTIAQIERVDPTMREYVAAETRAREALDAAREGSYGYKHP